MEMVPSRVAPSRVVPVSVMTLVSVMVPVSVRCR